jgi:UDP-N-acetylglucosamine 2-epimerase
MKILSIIGTRPQYVKIKPIFDYCNENDINHIIVDTNQHYSENVSDYFIEEFSLRIDHDLRIPNNNEISFITHTMEKFVQILKEENPDFVLIYGDTNSTLASSLVCHKQKIPFAHVEAGLRCNDIKVPEELNRIVADITSTVQFTPIKKVLPTLHNGILCGDLEYELLNNNYDKPISYDGPIVMTIHRQKNQTKEKLNSIFHFCETLDHDINFYIHHQTKKIIDKNNIILPENIKQLPAAKYHDMVDALLKCRFIITDSGGLTKTSPFFGKKSLVMRDVIEWDETEINGYSKRYINLDDLEWINECTINRNKRFYLGDISPSKTIIDSIKKLLDVTEK